VADAQSGCALEARLLCQPDLTKTYAQQQDEPDSGVREAVGRAMGVLASALAAAAPDLAGGDAATNPLLRVAVDALADQKHEVQAAAAHAFAQARPRPLSGDQRTTSGVDRFLLEWLRLLVVAPARNTGCRRLPGRLCTGGPGLCRQVSSLSSPRVLNLVMHLACCLLDVPPTRYAECRWMQRMRLQGVSPRAPNWMSAARTQPRSSRS